MKRVLLTGATGFVGRHAVQPLLDRGFEVHCTARTVPVAGGPNVMWHEADLLDPVATGSLVRELGASHLLHFAWYADHRSFWEAAENLDWVASSLHLVRAFREAGGRRVVVAGTCAEYDWSSDCCDDSAPLVPTTLYGASKNALREVVEAYCRSTGMSSAWGRIFFTFGPGEQPTRVIAAVAQALLRGESVACTTGTQVRDFLYVEDVASAFARLVDGAETGPFDIGSGTGRALRELLERLQLLAGRRGLLGFGDLPDRLEPTRIVADSEHRRLVPGWSPRFTLDEGLTRTLAWWETGAAGLS